ncbi:MAG: MFS transporter [Gammaproteobacteria bacterium]|nr:MFS transporter [Gammaproteobacteria bacterium]
MSTSALSNRNFLIFISGTTVSLLGVWIYRVALGWLAWQLSHSEFWVGVVAFTQFAPMVFLGPLFGVFADRFDRRTASILVNSLSSINMLVLATLAFQGSIDIYILASLSLVQGILDGAYAPVRLAMVPNLVSAEQRHSAIALTSVAFNLSRFVGPAIAGFIIATWAVGPAFAVNAATYLAVVAAMKLIGSDFTPGTHRVRKHPWLELVDGARYVLAHEIIRLLLLISAVRCIFGRGSLEMLPAFADVVYNGGAAALSTLTSAIGAGAIVAGIVLSRGTAWLTVNTIKIGVVAAGVLVAILGVVDRLSVAIPIVAALGTLLSFGGVGSQILIQSLVDDDVRGRVSSFWSAAVFGGTALGSLAIGALASAWDLQHAVTAAGLLGALIIIATVRRQSSS